MMEAQKTSSPGILDDLKTLRDELRVKAHLAEQDARDAWARLAPKVREFELKAQTVGDRLAEDMTHRGRELKKQMQGLLDRMKR